MDNVRVHYLISEFYTPSASGGIRHDDPEFCIEWPLPVAAISDKDKLWPLYAASRANPD
jgi:dTDP-4-dehydrorhamnose 3,5-epimerase